jgi:hypothetical protein
VTLRTVLAPLSDTYNQSLCKGRTKECQLVLGCNASPDSIPEAPKLAVRPSSTSATPTNLAEPAGEDEPSREKEGSLKEQLAGIKTPQIQKKGKDKPASNRDGVILRPTIWQKNNAYYGPPSDRALELAVRLEIFR